MFKMGGQSFVLLPRLLPPDAGRRVFESRCARCHGPEGGGGELGPAIVARVAARSDQELSALITAGASIFVQLVVGAIIFAVLRAR